MFAFPERGFCVDSDNNGRVIHASARRKTEMPVTEKRTVVEDEPIGLRGGELEAERVVFTAREGAVPGPAVPTKTVRQLFTARPVKPGRTFTTTMNNRTEFRPRTALQRERSPLEANKSRAAINSKAGQNMTSRTKHKTKSVTHCSEETFGKSKIDST